MAATASGTTSPATLQDLRCSATMQSIEDVALEHGITTNVDIYLLNPGG